MPNKWCVLFYWLLVCLDIPGEFVRNTQIIVELCPSELEIHKLMCL